MWYKFFEERVNQIKKYSMGVGHICLNVTQAEKLMEALKPHKAKWEFKFNMPELLLNEMGFTNGWFCSNCGNSKGATWSQEPWEEKDKKVIMDLNDERTPYCPHCGYEMENFKDEY